MRIAPLALPLLLAAALPAQAQPATATAPPAMVPDPATAADCQRIIDSYRQLLVEGGKPSAESLQKFIATLTGDGNWPDINYADKTVSGWKPLEHMQRVLNLYLALRQPGTPFFNDEKTRDAAARSLHWWLLNKPTESQWYHKEISVPRNMRDIIILAGADLTGADRDLAMKQLEQLHVANAGANLVWSADLGLHDAALRGDGATAGALALRLAQEIKVSGGEGIQTDWSFHQHGARLQTFHYGGAYFADASRIAWELRDTRWAWSGEKISLLSGMALEGMRWQMRGNTTVPSTLDRSVTRQGALRANVQTTLRRLAQSDPQRGADLNAFASAVDANAPAVQGFRWYPRSDFAAYHTPGSSFFFKTLSSRTLNSESINQENLRGAQLNIGDHYIMRNGQEYYDMMGSWDWKQIPGLTWPAWADVNWQDIATKSPFSGAVTDGKSAIVAWQQQLQNKEKTRDFAVKNATFIHGNVIVSLWTDEKNHTDGVPDVQTTLEQSRLQGDVIGGVDAGQKITGDKDGLTWVNHNSTGYIALQPGTLSVSAGPRTGNWKSINAQYSADLVTNPTFTASIHHAAGQTQGGYVILLNSTPEETRALASKPTWFVRVQMPEVQSVFFDGDDKNKASMTVFFAAGKSPREYSVDRPCLIMSSGDSELTTTDEVLKGGPFIWVSDPLQTGGTLTIDEGEVRPLKVELPKDGSSKEIAMEPWNRIDASAELKTPFRPLTSLIRLNSLE